MHRYVEKEGEKEKKRVRGKIRVLNQYIILIARSDHKTHKNPETQVIFVW